VKKLLLFVVVAALALTLVPLALAGAPGGGGWKHGKAKFNLVGKVTAVDATAGTVTIKVKAGTKTVRAFRGTDKMMTVAAEARILWLADGEATVITLDQVQVGARVKARGVVDRTNPTDPVLTIRHLKVHQPPVEEPTPPPAE
jgi:hypothetical protein